MTAQTGESTQRSAGRAIDCARGEALHAAEVGATQNAASPAPSCATVIPRRREYTYSRWPNQYVGLRADDAKGRSGQARPLGTGQQAPPGGEAPRKQDYELELRRFEDCGPAHKRLNALLSAGSLPTSVNTAQTASRSSSLRTFTEPVLPSTTASLIDTAMLAEPFCLSLRASSSTSCGTRRTNERSRHRTVSKLSALAFIRVLVCVPEVLQRFPARRCTRATLRRRPRGVSEVGEPVVDATPRGVRVRVLEGVERIAGFYAQLELVVGAVVADENRDGVCVR